MTTTQPSLIIALMYETYVPISETIVERKPPTIADIVREKTDDGARIIDFFLDLMEGRVDDAKLCHRIDAAKQLVKYGSKEAADFLAEHGDEPCDHCESRKRGPRPRKDAVPAAGPPYAAPHLTPDFLTLLTEDFFAVLTAVDEDLMIKLVRGQTRDGDAIVEFLDDVMHNRVDGFKANHRISAARELISHILRDEHGSHNSVIPAHASVVPAANPIVVPAKAGFLPQEPSPIQRNGVGRSEPAEESAHVEPTSIVVPAKAGTQRSGGARNAAANSDAEPNLIVVPAKAGFLPQEPSPTQRSGEGRGSHSSSVHPEPVEGPVLSAIEGPRPEFTEGPADNSSVVPASEPVKEPVPSTLEGSLLETKNSKLESLPSRPSRTQRRRQGDARVALRREALGRSPPR